MNIIDTKLKFTRVLTKRTKTTAIVVHHRAGEGDVQSIHDMHIKDKEFAGIGYNFYIRLNGLVYLGRGWPHIGAHAGSENGYNSKSIGICFEGNYETRKTMPRAQFDAGVELIQMALVLFPTIEEIKGHGEVSATACPGKYFPLDEMRNKVLEEGPMEDKTGDNPSKWAKEHTEWAKANEIIFGDGQGNYNWQGAVTREAEAAMLHNFAIRFGLEKGE